MEIEFTIFEPEDVQIRGIFYVPDGFDVSLLEVGVTQAWQVAYGAGSQPLTGSAALCIIGFNINGQMVYGDGIRPC